MTRQQRQLVAPRARTGKHHEGIADELERHRMLRDILADDRRPKLENCTEGLLAWRLCTPRTWPPSNERTRKRRQHRKSRAPSTRHNAACKRSPSGACVAVTKACSIS